VRHSDDPVDGVLRLLLPLLTSTQRRRRPSDKGRKTLGGSAMLLR